MSHQVSFRWFRAQNFKPLKDRGTCHCFRSQETPCKRLGIVVNRPRMQTTLRHLAMMVAHFALRIGLSTRCIYPLNFKAQQLRSPGIRTLLWRTQAPTTKYPYMVQRWGPPMLLTQLFSTSHAILVIACI